MEVGSGVHVIYTHYGLYGQLLAYSARYAKRTVVLASTSKHSCSTGVQNVALAATDSTAFMLYAYSSSWRNIQRLRGACLC